MRPFRRSATSLRVGVLSIALLATMTPPAASGQQQQRVYITELMAWNKETLCDKEGNDPDWIELYNATSAPISLAGWELSDGNNDWQFPPGAEIGGESYLVIFVSGYDHLSSLDELHTNFRFNYGDGEVARLTRDDGGLEDRIEFGPQQQDVSFGQVSRPETFASPDSGELGFLERPTPGKSNDDESGHESGCEQSRRVRAAFVQLIDDSRSPR